MKKSDRLIHAIVDLHETEALDIVKTRLELIGEAPKVMRETRKAMQIVGERFEAGEYFIPELIFSGEIMKGINALVKPKLLVEKKESKTQVALGTVQGDIHDIGKDMVSFMLEINGFTVHDQGVDVSPGQFVASGEILLAIWFVKKWARMIGGETQAQRSG
jgi:5-methyltetrahydrofolate--homocysteine methyltransferase